MKAKWTAASLTIVAVKIAAISLIASLAWNCWTEDLPRGIRRQDVQEINWLIATWAISSSAAILLLTPRNLVRVLINTPILLLSTIIGIVVALESAGGAHDFAARVWSLVLIGGACGAFFGHILLAIGWAFAKWLKPRRPVDRPPPTEMTIPAWR